jgi:hypothetical protein
MGCHKRAWVEAILAKNPIALRKFSDEIHGE